MRRAQFPGPVFVTTSRADGGSAVAALLRQSELYHFQNRDEISLSELAFRMKIGLGGGRNNEKENV